MCRVHGGGAPQVARKRAERIALAEAAARNPRRHPGEVLLDALHWADTHARQLAEHSDSSADSEKLLAELERAARLAETALRLDTEGRGMDVIEREAEQVVALLRNIFDDQLRALVSLLTVHAPEALGEVESRWPAIVADIARERLGSMHERTVAELPASRRRGSGSS